LKKTAVQLQRYALLNTSTHKLEITEMKNSLLTDALSVTSFQQDNAPAHRARETVEFLSRNTPDFIAPSLWQPNSPDLNPVDYQVWSALQQRVYQSRIHNVEQLKKTLIEEWHHFPQGIIDYAIKQWHVRLRACS